MLTSEAIYRIARLSSNPAIVDICSRFHIGMRDSEALARACARCSGIDTAPAREIFFFAAAVLKRHHEQRAAYSVALRASA